MRIYYDQVKKCVLIDGVYRFFGDGNLTATNTGDLVTVKYTDTDTNEIAVNYTQVLNESGTQAGETVTDTVNYLNGEFEKDGTVEGNDSFDGLDSTVTVIDNRLNDGDIIIINPTVSVINEIYFPTVVVNNSFTVNRIVINVVGGLTSNLPFKWRRLK